MDSQETATLQWLRIKSNVAGVVPTHVEISEVIAEGGQGIVYAGGVNGIAAAIKVYFPGQVQKRIDREIAALGSLDCNAIARLLWSGNIQVNGHELMVVATSLIPGLPLNKLLEAGPVTHNQLAIIAFDVATAITAMWDKLIVHRDLKPSNIVIRPDHRACVIDLGLARHLSLTTITEVGHTGGTRGYLSPEQTQAVRALTCKSDLYGLGVVLLESGLGRHPTRRDQHLLTATDYYEKLPSELAGWQYATLLRRLLHKRPTARPMPAEVINILSRFGHPGS